MITKGEIENLKRLKPLVEPYVDEWVVVMPPKDSAIQWAKDNGLKVIVKDFTQGIEDKVSEVMLNLGVKIPNDYRIFNFANARNESLNNCTGDYILWLDADDEPVGLENLVEILKDNKNADMFQATYDYARDAQGNSISDHPRERVIKNNGKFEWRGGALGLIHETILPKDGEVIRDYKLGKEVFYVKHISDHHDNSSDRNFIALLYEYIVTKGSDPRTTYYLGTELFNHKMYAQSAEVMQEYLKTGNSDDDRYNAWIRTAESYHQLEDKESSRNAYLSAIKELPNRPDAYMGLGESYFSDDDWARAIEFTMTGMQKPLPQTKGGLDPIRYTFRACNFLALSHFQLGRLEDAYNWFTKAKKFNPNHPWVIQYTDMFEEAKDTNDYVKAFVKLGQITQRRFPKFKNKLSEIIPDELQDQELLLHYKRENTTPKIWPNNSIVYFCSSAFEDWGPDSLKTGTGGSEEAVINLTKRWAKMGYDVTVFNNCPEEKTVDGVKWVRWEKFNPRDIFNILIGWRNNPFLQPKVAKKKYVDAHDVPAVRYFPENSLKDVTLMVKSNYHRTLFPHLKDENFTIIPNGINTAQFENPVKVKNNLCWTSSYDRGLEYLLDMWQDIRKEVPDATLDVAYGFNLYDASARGKTPEGKKWKQKMLSLLDQEGITHHGRLNSDQVAELYKKADTWAYPTDFPEICCITATKSMASGAIPVTTKFGSLIERNQGVLVDGIANDPQVRENFKNELIALLKDDKRKEEIRAKLDVSTYDWDLTAQKWDEEFKK